MNRSEHSPPDPDFEERVRSSFARQGLMKHLDVKLTSVEPGKCEMSVGFKPELSQQHGFFHAGVIATLADNAGGYAAYTLLDGHSSMMTVEFKLNLLRPADGEVLAACGEVVRAGRTLSVCKTDVFTSGKNGEQKLCATSLMTLMTLKDSGHPKEKD